MSHTYEVTAMIEGTLRDVRDTKAIAPCSALAGHPWVSKEKSLIINNKIEGGLRLVRCLLQVPLRFPDLISSESEFRQAC